jgi:hypothetical protein
MTTPGTTRRSLALTALLAFICAPSAHADPNPPTAHADARKAFLNGVTPFVNAYCTECHSDRKSKGGLNYQSALKDPGSSASRKRWKQALANVKAHDMPPKEADRQPTDDERQQFLDWIGKLKFLSAKDPGLFVIRRLTKTEYGNTLHDLFGVDPSIARDLPDEVSGAGYLNTLSPLQSEQYLEIATKALDQALPPNGTSASETLKPWFSTPPADGTDPKSAATLAARSLARKAFRRPPSDAEIQTLLAVFDLGLANNLSYPDALRLMLKAILVSPSFLFITPASAAPQGQSIIPLDDHQLASRLSYLLWATMPDAELSALADSGQLHQPETLTAQTRRLLADPRSRALFDGFGTQWLGLGDLRSKTFDPARFPQMSADLRDAMIDEARLFFDSIVRENLSVIRFIDSDFTFLNAPLAALYGMESSVTGPEMRRVSLTDPNRGGILGMPAVLAATSFPNRTSPVRRGVFVLEQVLGEHVPPAPPNVPALDKQDPSKVASLTLRQRTELHRTNAVCANCHNILDPIGFGLENFDAIGRWRSQDDSGGPIDAAGDLPGNHHFASPRDLKSIIAARTSDIARNLTEKLLAYALCRQLEGYDEIIVDQLMATLAKDDFRMQSLVTAIVTSYPFTHRRITDD